MTGGLKSGATLRLEAESRPRSPAAQLADYAELRQLLDATKPRSLWRRLRDAWAGMVAGWRGEAWWRE